MQWLADLGGVFYSIKEKGYSAREKRATEYQFIRKMEIEAKMAEDKEREARRLADICGTGKVSPVARRVTTSVVKRVGTNGVVKRPMTPRVGRGF